MLDNRLSMLQDEEEDVREERLRLAEERIKMAEDMDSMRNELNQARQAAEVECQRLQHELDDTRRRLEQSRADAVHNEVVSRPQMEVKKEIQGLSWMMKQTEFLKVIMKLYAIMSHCGAMGIPTVIVLLLRCILDCVTLHLLFLFPPFLAT